MIRWFTKNHVAANLLMLGILIIGIWVAVEKIGIEVEPSYKVKQVRIDIDLPGASPEDIENQIILPIESAIKDTPGIAKIISQASSGNADIDITVDEFTDIDKLKVEIESRIQGLSTLPQEAEKPQIRIPDTSSWQDVLAVTISGHFTKDELLTYARKIRNDLEAKDGISKTRITGVQDKEISINLIPEKLNAYNLTFDDVERGIRQSSIDLSAGTVSENGQTVSIRSTNKAYYGDQFRKLAIKKDGGSVILLEDIAEIQDTFQEDIKETYYNGRPTILIDVLRRDGENALKISDIVHDYVEESQATLPEGLYMATWDDDSVSLRGRIKTLLWSLIQGGLLVMIVLGLFLRPSVAFWVTIGIPVSFAGAAICMYLFGVTINNMSLFGFIIVLGLVVDDAIVTGESIYAKARSGKYSQLDAAVIGTTEVATPVTFGVITTMAAFVPLMLGDDYFSNLKRQIPLIVLPVLVFSLIESKFILPAHLKHLKSGEPSANWLTRIQDKIANSLQKFIQKVYQPLLNTCIKFRYAVICAFIAVLAITISFFTHKMEYKNLPSVERYFIFAYLDMKQGTEIEVTKQRLKQIEDGLIAIKPDFTDKETGESLISNTLAIAGGSRKWSTNKPDRAWFMAEITPPSQRSSEEITNEQIVSAWTKEVGEIKGASYFIIRGQSSQGKHHKGKDGLNIQIRGNNEEAKTIIADQFEQWIDSHPAFQYPNSSQKKATRELQLQPKSNGSSLTEQSLAEQVRTAFNGTRVEQIQRGEDEINVMLRLPEEVRTSIHSLNTLRINLPDDTTAPLTQFADLIETSTPPYIEREDGARVMELKAKTVDGYKLISMEQEVIEKMTELCAPYPDLTWKLQGTLADYKQQKKESYTQLAFIVLALFTLLAIPFKSFLQPFYVLLAVPFGIVGAIWGHHMMGAEVTLLSFLGMLALTGIVVNDSLVLVDYINLKVREGMSLKEAVLTAGARRFRPIILTSLTTFAGLMPLLAERSIQAQFLIPMAISLGFGILFATAITLILIPCCYMVGEELKATLIKFLRWFLMLKPKSSEHADKPEQIV